MAYLLMTLLLLVFARIDPSEFEQCFRSWVKTIAQIVPGKVISIDGKILKHSGSEARGKKAIHLVSAWAKAAKISVGSSQGKGQIK